jgi:hypothetical protein
MFPILDFRLSGMDLNHYYSCMVQIVSANNHHYRYDLTNDKWVVTGSAVKLDLQHSSYVHPHGSTLGRVWMREGAKFDKLKLSNHIKPYCDHVSSAISLLLVIIKRLNTAYVCLNCFYFGGNELLRRPLSSRVFLQNSLRLIFCSLLWYPEAHMRT